MLKFRLWTGKRMVYPSPINKSSKNPSELIDSISSLYNKAQSIMDGESYELMQWTGKVDKYGQEIFEKDIVLRNGKVKGEIKYSDEIAAFVFVFISPMGTVSQSKLTIDLVLEVIGNSLEDEWID